MSMAMNNYSFPAFTCIYTSFDEEEVFQQEGQGFFSWLQEFSALSEPVFEFLHRGFWAYSVDLKDAYFHVPIHPRSRRFLRFAYKNRVLQFKALPFGLSSAPWLFTRIMAELKKMVNEASRLLYMYLDDWLGEAPDEE